MNYLSTLKLKLYKIMYIKVNSGHCGGGSSGYAGCLHFYLFDLTFIALVVL